MPKNNNDKQGRVGVVRGPVSTSSIDKTGAVSHITETKKASPVSGVRGPGTLDALRGTRIMTMAERAQLFEMIHEEADKLFAGKKVPAQHKEIVEQAVKMTIDAALLEEEQKKK